MKHTRTIKTSLLAGTIVATMAFMPIASASGVKSKKPTTIEIVGVCVVTIGMIAALGLLKRWVKAS